jgi:putative CocE/NonD family hydrolase
VVGPWDHAGTRTPSAEFGGMKFGEASLVDLNKLHSQWYDWTMKKGKRPQFLKKRVAYYVMGAEKWKYADALEAVTRRTLGWHLVSDGTANDAFHSGWLEPKAPRASPPDAYTYDPLDTRPGGLEREEIKDFITDQTYDLNLFGNGLVYHSAPLARATEITGWPKLWVWLSLDVPDTDFSATLSEVMPNGKVIRLTQDQLRARYRESLREAELVRPGEIVPYAFEGFPFFSRRLTKGSRLRLVIGCINSIFYQKNYNAGGVVAHESGKDARTAHITLHHDAEHPSCLELPVGR